MSISPAHISLSLIAAITGSLSMLSPQAVAQADAPLAQSTVVASSIDTRVRYRTVEIDGITLFYREAGPANAPVVMLLHGFPASSFMYRDLMKRLAGKFHVIAPDYPGFGYSDAPSTQGFPIRLITWRISLRSSPTGLVWTGTPCTCRTSAGPSDSAQAGARRESHSSSSRIPTHTKKDCPTVSGSPPALCGKIRRRPTST